MARLAAWEELVRLSRCISVIINGGNLFLCNYILKKLNYSKKLGPNKTFFLFVNKMHGQELE